MLYFVWLGSRRAKRQGVGNEGILLDVAAGAGLPVPAGAILLDTFYQLCLKHGLLTLIDGQVIIPDPLLLSHVLYEEAHLPRLSRPVTITPILSTNQPLAVLAQEPIPLAKALEQAWSAIEANSRHDLVLLESTESENSGLAYSQQAYQDDLVYGGGQTIALPQLQSWESATTGLPPFAGRLQKLLRGLRRTLGPGNWAVNWADDGQICWLVALRPGCSPASRQDNFISPAQLWPDLPAPLVCHIITNSPHFGRPYLPPGRDISQLANGQLLLNQSFGQDSRRQWGLPKDAETRRQWWRMVSHAPLLLRLKIAHRLAIRRVNKLAQIHALVDYANLSPALSAALSTLWLLGREPTAIKQALQIIYQQLVTLATEAVAADQLPTSDSFWLLSLTQMQELESGRFYPPPFFSQPQP